MRAAIFSCGLVCLSYVAPVCSLTVNNNSSVQQVVNVLAEQSPAITCSLWVDAREDDSLFLEKGDIKTSSVNAEAVSMYVRGFLDTANVVLDKKLLKSVDDSCAEDPAKKLVTVLKKHGVPIKATTVPKTDPAGADKSGSKNGDMP